jgi:hypothetical protein
LAVLKARWALMKMSRVWRTDCRGRSGERRDQESGFVSTIMESSDGGGAGDC